MASSWPPFSYNQQMFGGTEYMARGVVENILPQVPKFYNYLCIVTPGKLPSLEREYYMDKKIIVWIHNMIDQLQDWVFQTLNDPDVAKNIQFIIGVSEYHKQRLMQDFTNVPADRFVAIPNAFEPVDFDPQKFVDVQKVKLIHASSSYRGMEVLLGSLKDVEGDFELNVFNDFYPDATGHPFADLANDSRVNFWGKTPRKIVSKFMSEAHIHAYPSIWEETFCLVQAEAMSAGLLCVYSDFGALPETSLGYGIEIPYFELSDFYYAEFLTKAIQRIKNGEHDPIEQSKAIREKYSWDRVLEHWKALEERL